MKFLRTHTRNWLVVGLVLASIVGLVTQSYLHSGFPYTHDGENHLARFANYKIALKEGQIPPRFAPNLMNHYGYPVFNYNYPLANILSVPFSVLKFNYELTFKILAATSLFFGAVGLYLWLQTFGFKTRSSLIATSTALTSPYLVSLVLFRGNIGEILAWGLLPWIFWFFVTPVKNEKTTLSIMKTIHAVFGIFLTAAFYLSHNVTAFFATPIVILGMIITATSKKQLLNRLLHFSLGIGLTLWFWLPAVLEKNQVILDSANLSLGFGDHFPHLSQLILSKNQFGFSYLSGIDSMSFSLGLLVWVSGIVFSLHLLKKVLSKSRSKSTQHQIQKNRLLLFCVSLTIGLILTQLKFSQQLWEIVPFIRFIQFPWRLTFFITLVSAPLVAAVIEIDTIPIKWVLGLLLTIQVLSTTRVAPIDYFHKNIVDYDAFSQSTTTLNENTPKTFTFEDFSAQWQPTAEIISGAGEVTVKEWRGSNRSYLLELTEPSTIIEPTMYFLGWKTQIIPDSGSSYAAEYIFDDQTAGRIAYTLPQGSFHVISTFTQHTPARLIGNSISGLLMIGILTWSSFRVYQAVKQR